MQLFAADDAIAALESSLSELRGDARVAATVALAWHLRQRDSTRALRLVDGVIGLLGGLPKPAWAPMLGPIAHRARAALAVSEARALLGEFDEAERWLADAGLHLDPASDAHAEGDAFLVESVVAKSRGQRPREMAALERAIETYAASGAPERLAVARMWARYERAFERPEADAPPDLARPGPDWPDACTASDALAGAARALGLAQRDPSAAAATYEQAATQARRVGMVRLEVVALIGAGAAHQSAGDHDLASDCLDRAATRAKAAAWPVVVGAADTRIGELLRTLGALEESRALLVEAVDRLAVAPGHLHAAIAQASLAQTLLAMGRADESLAPMREAVAALRESGFTQTLAINLVLQGRGLAAAGRVDEAAAVLAEAQALVDRHDMASLRPDIDEVRADLHHRFDLPPPAGMRLPTASLHFAEAALAGGLAVAGWQAPARLHAFLAERWAEAGVHASAYTYARQALRARELEAARQMDFPLALARLRRHAADAATPLMLDTVDVRSRPASSRTLTPKERSILLLLARDYSNKEIAKSIAMSDETVKWHLKNLFTKLGAGSRKHAVTRARTLGFIGFQG